jgi:hypothetical protein
MGTRDLYMAGNFRGIRFQRQLTSSEISMIVHRSTMYNARIIILFSKNKTGKDRHPGIPRAQCMHACMY